MFKNQLVLLLKLWIAILEHGVSSTQANDIRDKADDGSWHELSDDDKNKLKDLSDTLGDYVL